MAIDGESIFDVVVGDGAIFELIETYHVLESTLGWDTCHEYEAADLLGTLNLMFSETVIVFLDHVHMEMICGRWIGGSNEEVSCLRVLINVKYTEAIGSGREF